MLKDSIQKYTNRPPGLARHYTSAQKKIFGRSTYVHKKMWPVFRLVEKRLREEEIDPLQFAESLTAMLKPWAEDKKLKYIPIKTFCSDWAIKKAIKVFTSRSVSINSPEEDLRIELEYSERLVAQVFINDPMLRTFGAAINDMIGLLSHAWLHAYKNDNETRIQIYWKTLKELAEEYGILDAESYKDIKNRMAQ